MPRQTRSGSSAQTIVECFPIQKRASTRSQLTKKTTSERKTRNSSRTPIVDSPSKRKRSHQEELSENCILSPSKCQDIQETASPSKRKKSGGSVRPRLILSPIKIDNVQNMISPSKVARSNLFGSPTQNSSSKSNYRTEDDLDALDSQILALAQESPEAKKDKSFLQNVKVKTAKKSAQKQLFSQERKMDTQGSKVLPKETCASPIKSPLQPSHTNVRNLLESPSKVVQRNVLSSPSKFPSHVFYSPKKDAEHTLRSPRKYLDMTPSKPTSPSKPCPSVSPSKRALFRDSENSNTTPNVLSPTKRVSPRKRLLDAPIRQSPRKLDVASPVRQSPRKHNVMRELSSPLRLARQQGLCYQRAKQALHTAMPERIVCREEELQTVEKFLKSHMSNHTPGSMYISGAPGTGKTAVLSYIIKGLQEQKKAKLVYINCMSFKNSQAIFNKILFELTGRETTHPTKEAAKKLEKLISSGKSGMVFILDEVDQLDSKNQEVLYTMFEWPTLPKSKLILIGIANALDLTDRILPRLQARPNCKPQLMHFSPYSKDQIMKVLQDRLQKVEVEGVSVMEPTAIRFCAMKVATVAGDMRKALDICRRAVESVEAQVRKQHILTSTLACTSPTKSKTVIPQKIGVPHIMRIVNEVYGSRVNPTGGSTGGGQTIPLQQKLAICTLLLMVKQAKNGKEVPLGKLHEKYSLVCKRQHVDPTTQSEFLSMCSLIEAKGIMGLKKAKDARNTKVSLKLDEGELEQALQDKVLVSTILQKGLP